MYYANQFIITYLSTIGGINNSQTTGIKVQSATGIETDKPGIALLSYADPLNEDNAEWIYYTSIDGSNIFQGVTRGAEKGSAKPHGEGVAIAFPVSESHNNQFADIFQGTVDESLADNVLLENQSSTPTTPASGHTKTFMNTNGSLEILDSAGNKNVIGEVGIETATDGATVTFDISKGRKQTVTLGGNRTLALSNVNVGDVFMLDLVQDGTGSRTVTWFSTIKWAGGSAPTLTTTADKTDTFGFICTSSGNYQGYVVGQNL